MERKTKIIRIFGVGLIVLSILIYTTQPAHALIMFTNDVFENDADTFRIGSDYDAGTNALTLEFGGTNTESLHWDTTQFSLTNNLNVTGDITLTGTVDGIDVAAIGLQAHNQNTDTGTSGSIFTLDSDDTGGNVTMKFGASLAETLLWDNSNSRFTLSDDVRAEGSLAVIGQTYIAVDHTATDSDGTLNLGRNGSVWENLVWNDTNGQFELSDDLSITGGASVTSNIDLNSNQLLEARIENLASGPTCDSGSAGRLYQNTTSGYSFICNGASWIRLDDSVVGSGDDTFESVYANDGDSTLTTTNAAFTINTGTNDFIVTSNDWSVNSNGNLTASNITANGILDADGVVTIGDSGDTVTIDSSSWDISSAGAATGLTGITSTGNINFVNASTFRIPQAASDPGTCSEGQQYYNTATDIVRVCTATDTWSNLTPATGANYVYAYDTTTQTVASGNVFQDITFNTNGSINGWTHTPGSANFTAGASGLYLVSVNAGLTGTSSSAIGELRAMFNGAEIAGSQVARDATSEYMANIISSTFLLNATSGQILKFQFTAPGTNVSINPAGSNATTRPSIKVSIVRLN